MKRVGGFVGAVTVAGAACFVARALPGDVARVLLLRPADVAFTLFVVLGELLPMKVPRRDEVKVIATSTTFSFAPLLTAGVLPAIVAQAVASLLADAIHKK